MRFILAFAAFATAAQAEIVGESVSLDLDKDGTAETFWLENNGDGTVNLRARDTGYGDFTVEDIAWIGGPGQIPILGQSPAGSLTVTAMNIGIGRNRWESMITIAYRRDRYRVVGLSYGFYDSLDLDSNGTCDLNLLTGRGVVVENEVQRDITAPIPALPVFAWTERMPIFEFCFGRDD